MEENKNPAPLNDEELDGVTGGGFSFVIGGESAEMILRGDCPKCNAKGTVSRPNPEGNYVCSSCQWQFSVSEWTPI